jgi:hypothetical protein
MSLAAQATKTPANPPATQTKTAATKTAAPQTKAADTKATPQGTAADRRRAQRGISVAPESTQRVPPIPPIIREIYDYDNGNRRDPFLSLLTSQELRPALNDLKLVAIIYDESGRRPIAIMREAVTNTQYRVTTGSTLGRLKVALIKRRSVIFSIEEFGLNRQDSLVLGDTTKARVR